MVVQVITLPDQEYAAYRMRIDWIQKHIFPGGHMPSLAALGQAMTRRSTLIECRVPAGHSAEQLAELARQCRGAEAG